MPIASYGYDGTMGEADFARASRFYGGPAATGGAADWAVTAVSGADRTIQVAPGEAYDSFVYDVLTAPSPTKQHDAVTVGTSRWDTVVARRDWTATAGDGKGGVTSVEIVKGGASAVPIVQFTEAGTKKDQPLALVELRANQQAPATIIDLRRRPAPFFTASNLRAAGTDLPVNSVANLNGDLYRWTGSAWEPCPRYNLTESWFWGSGGMYGPARIPDGNWNEVPGCKRTVSVIGGHLYSFTSNFTMVSVELVRDCNWRASLQINGAVIKEVFGKTSSREPNTVGESFYPTELTKHWVAPTTGRITIRTCFAAGMAYKIGIHNPWASPLTEFVDLGLRVA